MELDLYTTAHGSGVVGNVLGVWINLIRWNARGFDVDPITS